MRLHFLGLFDSKLTCVYTVALKRGARGDLDLETKSIQLVYTP